MDETPPVETSGLADARENAAIPEPSPIIDSGPQQTFGFEPISPPQASVNPEFPGWDPGLHCDPPRKNRTGEWRKRKHGVATPATPVDATRVDDAAERRIAAENFVNITIAICTNIFGEEWQPNVAGGIDERERLTSATDDYFAVAGVTKLPAWAGLAIAFSAYSLPRFAMPETRYKMASIVGRIKHKFRKKTYGNVPYPNDGVAGN